MYYSYILENNKGRRYIGSCEDIAKRLNEHNANSIRSTKNKGPFKLVFKEDYEGALKRFTKCIELKDDSFEAYYNRGFAYELLKNDNNYSIFV